MTQTSSNPSSARSMGKARWIVSVVITLVTLFGSMAPYPATSALAQPAVAPAVSALRLSVISANDSNNVTQDYGIHKGDPITQFKYIINIDNSGTTVQRSDAVLPGGDCSPVAENGVGPNPNYPAACAWVSVAGRANHSPIYTQGTQDDFPDGVFTIDGQAVELPAGRYLISILADNFKIDGAHFTVPGSGEVTVEMQPYDLPTATIQSAVFEDMAPTNSAPDLPVERGLAGFRAHINDYVDEVTTDVFGNPLGAEYDVNGGYISGTGGVVLSKCYVVANGVDVGWVDPVNALGECPLGFLADNDPLLATDITQMYDIKYPHTQIGIPAGAVIEGKVIIPNVGPNRYALAVTPPSRSGWIQTTTLEGNHDWDAWVMEGATGLDTEFVVGGEPFPATFFGFVPPSFNSMVDGANTIVGAGLAVSAYIPPSGGVMAGEGVMGAKAKNPNPIHRLFVSLSDLNNGDQTVFVGEFGCEINPALNCNDVPSFTIPNVPDGFYVLGVWDEPQDYIFAVQNVIVSGGTVNVGDISLLGWWTTFDGYVFNDSNGDGIKQDNEPGIPNFPIVMRTRENSIMDRGTAAVTTDANGYYWMESAYPMTQWLIMEAYADGFHTTGITYQADNQSTPTTVLGAGVDVNVHPVIGLGGRLDWGVQAYKRGENGGIVGTISYDTTRNELNPAYAAIEDWQPSIADLTVELYAPVLCGTHANAACDPIGLYELAKDGSYALGPLLNQYLSETWERPSGCVARDVNGDPLTYPADQQVLPLGSDIPGNNLPCLEAPMMGVQFGPLASDQGSPDANFGASVDGNYGFGDGCFMVHHTDPDPTLDRPTVTGLGLFDPNTGACVTGEFFALPSNRDYLVRVDVPDDAFGRPLYQVTREEDINVANGDSFVPQAPPPACAGALHTVDLLGSTTDNYPVTVGAGYDINGLPVGITVPASMPVENAPFLDMGGTIYEGQAKPLCDMKLVRLGDRKSIAPGFNFFTDVPLPGRFWGLIVDDLNWSSNPKQTGYGEKMGIPFAPVGIYDYTNRLIATVESDYNGLFDVLLPSTNRISCPTPSGVCANLYRLVGNDPGAPGKWNPNYNPQYRTISAEFEAFAGLTVPADLAPTQVAVSVQIPGSQALLPISCALNDTTGSAPAVNPEFFAISKPYMYTSDAARSFSLAGLAFGAQPGSVKLDGFTMTINSWSDTGIQFTVPSGNNPNTPNPGPHQLKITTADGKTMINALTFHVVAGNGNNSGNSGGSAYNPRIFEVGIGKTYDPTAGVYNPNNPAYDPSRIGPIQDALLAAAAVNKALVVVYPGAVDLSNPRYNGRGSYYENVIMNSPAKLQGVGPGGVYPDGAPVQGSIIDGLGFAGDTTMFEAWLVLADSLTRAGNQDINDGQVIYVVPRTNNQFGSNYKAAIDGFNIRGGDQQGLPGNLPEIFGTLPATPGLANVETQGGAIFANSYARNLQITNNVIESNGGSYGAIRIGTPNNGDQQNDNVRVANNRILANGGTNLAGAIGLFNGSERYEIANNDLCGNFSAEYGGGISHFGYSPNGRIHDNRIYFNRSYDEGAGIMIAGELPTNPGDLSNGSGSVNIYNNLIQANVSDDDGGGIRFLMAGNFPMNVFNNMIVNNVSTHEGGGVALDDAPNVRFYNNTVMNNITTATALTSDGSPAPAGLSTGPNSLELQASLPVGSSEFSNPLMFNNIFWDNRAGYLNSNISNAMVFGIGAVGDAAGINNWDMGSVVPGIELSPTDTVLQAAADTISDASNILVDPLVIDGNYHIAMTFVNWRANINQINAIMVTTDLSPDPRHGMGNYHIQRGSPARDVAADSKTVGALTVNASTFDIDNESRPATNKDIGADEVPIYTDLSITKDDGITSIIAGSPIAYAIVVTNAGPDVATNASVTDNFPASLTGATWTCAASAGSTCAASGNGNINTPITLLAGGTATFTVNATLASNAAYSVSNTASVTPGSNAIDLNLLNNSATDTDTIPTADLRITKVTDNVNTVLTGGTVNYTITVTNAGPNDVTGATVTDTFPSVLTVTSWSCAATAGSSCTADGTDNNRAGTVNLLAGGVATYKGSATLSATASGTLSNSASVTAPAGITDPNLANNSATDTDTIRPSMHVGNLSSVTTNTSNTAWSATVTITTHDVTHNLLGGVTVSGSWTGGGSGGNSCTTSSTVGPTFGTCTVTRTGLAKTSANAVFTVGNVSKTGYGYLSSANDVSRITVSLLTMSPTFTSSAAPIGTNPWTATVTITVMDSNNNAVPNATVSGSWSSGTGSGSGSGACTTDAFGQCTVTRTGISNSRANTTYTVTNITKSSGSPAVVLASGTYTVTVNNP